MKFKFLLILAVLLLSPVANADVIINEIMYAPNSDWGGPDNEWIELYNNGTKDENITSWLIDGKLIPEASLSAGGYILLAKNSTKFQQVYGTSSVHVAFTYGLKNTGEILNLSSNSVAINVFDYTPYANLAVNNNHTLELNASGWFESTSLGGTPGEENSINSISSESTDSVPEEPQNTTDQPETIEQSADLGPATIEIMRTPENMEFGDYSSVQAKFFSGNKNFEAMRFVAYIYRPSWIARDLNANETTIRNSPYNANAAMEVSNILENETIRIALPIFLKCNTEGYASTTYTLRVRAYSYDGEWKTFADADAELSVSGENEACKNKAVCANKTTEKTCAEKTKIIREAALEINATYPDKVLIGDNFTTNISIKNNENGTKDLEIYSYLYEHISIMSSGFDGEKWGATRNSNAIKVSIEPYDSTTIELVLRAKENISAEKYTYKIRIDDLNNGKKSEERIYLIAVDARNTTKSNDENNSTESDSTEKENKITGAVLSKNTDTKKLSLLDKIIYKIKSWLM